MRVADLAQERFDAVQKFDLAMREGLPYLAHEQIVNLLVGQVYAALTQAVQGELHG